MVITLSDQPPEEWKRFFNAKYEEIARRRHFREMGVPTPSIQGSTVRIAPLDKDLEAWIKGIDETVEEANAYFRNSVLPGIKQEEEAERRFEEEAQRRVEDAQRRAKEL